MGIRVYNTLTGKKEELSPRKGKIRMYVCGPTVYNYIHLGNARCYVAFDVIQRYLKFRGYDVFYVRNITDVDDKIINQAREEKCLPEEIAKKYTQAFNQDMKYLEVEEANVSPKATEHIEEMQEMIEVLLKKEYAYEVEGNVFFAVTKFKNYGKLSHRTLEEMRAGERIEPHPSKRHPLDFVLWKKAKPAEPSWWSPWGRGRPGWHIECSAMSLKYLKMGFDIHGGGQDLIFPHHENEIAQSESYASKKPFAKYWLHNGFVNVNQEKMAKSLGNVILVRELFDETKNEAFLNIMGNALRILFLSHHYRSPIDFSQERLAQAIQAYNGLEDVLSQMDYFLEKKSFTGKEGGFEKKLSQAEEKFFQAMDDDFNTSVALGTIFDLKSAAQTFLTESSPTLKHQKLLLEAKEKLINLGKVLGLNLGLFKLEYLLSWLPQRSLSGLTQLFSQYLGKVCLQSKKPPQLKALLNKLLAWREEARQRKNWSQADKLRKSLKEIGLEIEDTTKGPRLKISFPKVLELLRGASSSS